MGLNLEPVPENPAKKRQIAFGVTGAACLLILVALFTKSWLRPADPLEGGMGVRSYEVCFGDDCESGTNKGLIEKFNQMLPEKEKRSPVFWIVGYVILISGLASVAFLAIAAALVAKGKFYLGKVAPMSVALLFLFLALIAGGVFMATNPTRGTALQLGTGWGFAVFGAGVVLGIVAAQMLTKFKPADDLIV